MKIDPDGRRIFLQMLPSIAATDEQLNQATAKLLGKVETQMDTLDTVVLPRAEKDVSSTGAQDPAREFKQKALASIKAYRQWLEDLFGPQELPVADRLRQAAGKLRRLIMEVDERFKGDYIPRDVREAPATREEFLAEEASIWLKGEFREHYQKTPGNLSAI